LIDTLSKMAILYTEHLLLPDYAFGTIFLYMSIDLICPWTPSAAN